MWKQIVDERGFQTMIWVPLPPASTTRAGVVRLGSNGGEFPNLEEWSWTNSDHALSTDVATIELVSTLAGRTFNEMDELRDAYNKADQRAGNPSTDDVPWGKFVLSKNTTTGQIRLWYNDNGVLKSVALA